MLYNDKYNGCSDEELLRLFSEKGDNQLIGVLYGRYGHLVLGLCIKYLRNKVEAQDAATQIFTNLITDLRKHQVQFFKSWLYTYSKNFCLMELRKRQVALKREIQMTENPHLFVDSTEPEHLKEKEDQIMLLETAIGMLNEHQQLCIRQFYLNGRSYNEIASETGYTTNDVKSYIQNGKRNLRIKIEELNGQRRQAT